MSEYIIDMSNSIYTSQDNLIHFDFSNIHEEIVRCRDCKFCHKNYCEKLISPTASPSEIFWIPVEPDGFCKWGERQTNNKTGDFVTHDSGKAVCE